MSKWIEVNVDDNQWVIIDGRPWRIGEEIACGMGSFVLRDTPKAGLHAVRLSGSKRFTYSVKLRRPGRYRLGAEYGFRVKPPEEETDPIKRVLREMEIPLSHLSYRQEVRWGKVLSWSTRRFESLEFFGAKREIRPQDDGCCQYLVQLPPAACIVVLRVEDNWEPRSQWRLADIVVDKACQPATLRKALAEAGEFLRLQRQPTDWDLYRSTRGEGMAPRSVW